MMKSNSLLALLLNAGSVCLMSGHAIAASTVPPTVELFVSETSLAGGKDELITFAFGNSNGIDAILSDAFVNSLPAGVVVSDREAFSQCSDGVATATVGTTTMTLSAGTHIPANGSCNVYLYVTSLAKGTYVATVPVGALKTDLGASVSTATATFATLGNALTVSSEFNPQRIAVGAPSRLNIRVTNDNSTPAITVLSEIVLAPELRFAAPYDAASDCAGFGFVVTSILVFQFADVAGTFPAHSTCTISFNVTSDFAAIYTNRITPQVIETDVAFNGNESDAILIVANAAANVHAAPVDSWTLMVLLALGLVAVVPLDRGR
jgi:hypothetical protein